MKSKIKESPLFWPAKFKNGFLFVLDETSIPKKLNYIKVSSTKEAVSVIRNMKTRAFGQFLVVLYTFLVEIHKLKRKFKSAPNRIYIDQIEKTADALNKSRPTFPFSEVTSIIVHWANTASEGDDMLDDLTKKIQGYLEGIRYRRLERVEKLSRLMKSGDSILTHCNVSGELAMAARICMDRNKKIHFFATETRPYMQGTKLTCWEMKRMGIDVTLIADNAVGSIISDGLVSKIIIGSDRSCANGDVANKIGSYQIAVLAKEFGIPFYVLTQPSDKIKKGEDIPIEIRNARELLANYKKKVASRLVEGFYPGFDVVPKEFITKEIAINVR